MLLCPMQPIGCAPVYGAGVEELLVCAETVAYAAAQQGRAISGSGGALCRDRRAVAGVPRGGWGPERWLGSREYLKKSVLRATVMLGWSSTLANHAV